MKKRLFPIDMQSAATIVSPNTQAYFIIYVASGVTRFRKKNMRYIDLSFRKVTSF